MEYFVEMTSYHSVCELPSACNSASHAEMVKGYIMDHVNDDLEEGRVFMTALFRITQATKLGFV